MQWSKRRNSEDSIFDGISQVSSVISFSQSSYDSIYEFEVNSEDISKKKRYQSKTSGKEKGKKKEQENHQNKKNKQLAQNGEKEAKRIKQELKEKKEKQTQRRREITKAMKRDAKGQFKVTENKQKAFKNSQIQKCRIQNLAQVKEDLQFIKERSTDSKTKNQSEEEKKPGAWKINYFQNKALRDFEPSNNKKSESESEGTQGLFDSESVSSLESDSIKMKDVNKEDSASDVDPIDSEIQDDQSFSSLQESASSKKDEKNQEPKEEFYIEY